MIDHASALHTSLNRLCKVVVKIVGTIFASNKSWPMQTTKLQSMLMFVDSNLSFLKLSPVFLDLFLC